MTRPDTIPCEHCCGLPTFKAREAQQHPYRGLWQALCARITDLSPDVPMYQRDLDRWLVELWAEQPEAARTFALATTRYDRPLDEAAPDFMEAA